MSTSAWPEENWARLGEAIARARRAKGWDQAALAMRTGNSPNTISNYERGRATRSRRVPSGLFRVAQVFGWPPNAVKQILDGLDPETALTQPMLDFGDSEQPPSAAAVASPRLMGMRDAELTASGHIAQDTFIRQMKRYRKLKGLSAEDVVNQVAALGGALCVEDLHRLENGTRLLQMTEAQTLAAALGTTVEWLLGSAFQSSAPEEMKVPPTDEELQAEAKAVERRLGEVGMQLNHAAMQRAQAAERAEIAKREADMAMMVQQQVMAQQSELQRQYHYLLGRIDSLRAAKGEEQILQTVLVEEEDDTLGKQLERARVQASMTYEDVHLLTRIRPEIIEAMERDDFEVVGGGSDQQAVYVRGHIRTLARAYGLAPEDLIREYDEVYADKQLPAHLREWRDLEERTGRQHRPRLRGRGFVTTGKEKIAPPEEE
ncbi:helix-turn-helix domain-containing protein [Streptomyces sp900105245]|uniref:Helix-turn-helix domain-containing protein n=1 Tax=Streptomyces sp. 900105245 TaxID=3154379 RepID=A0ABV1UCX8_9ACTN